MVGDGRLVSTINLRVPGFRRFPGKAAAGDLCWTGWVHTDTLHLRHHLRHSLHSAECLAAGLTRRVIYRPAKFRAMRYGGGGGRRRRPSWRIGSMASSPRSMGIYVLENLVDMGCDRRWCFCGEIDALMLRFDFWVCWTPHIRLNIVGLNDCANKHGFFKYGGFMV